MTTVTYAGEQQVRRHAQQVVREWVERELGTTVRRLRLIRSAYASSATVLNVHITVASGERLRGVYKLGGPGAVLPAARGVRPAFLSDPGREAWVYESVLSADGAADAPRLLATGPFGDGARWLLMEWVGSVDLGQVGSSAVWSDVASRLAQLHRWGESHLDALEQGSMVRWNDPGMHARWARRAQRKLSGLGPAAGTQHLLDPLWPRYDAVAARLAALPQTLVHGDFNASNILVTHSPHGVRIRIIDWETAGIGPGLLDLASLISGRLPDRYKADIVAAYRASLDGSPLGNLTEPEFDEALCWCRLALAVKWLGWSPGWSAPQAHAYDWRTEALATAHQLGLLADS